MENIKISVSERGHDEDISIVRVDGVIDTLTATQLEDVLDKLIKRGRYRLILDLAGVDYISSAGWGIFISRIKEIRENGGDVKLANMVPNVMEIYELLEFDNILKAYENVNAARSGFGGSSPVPDLKKKAPVAVVRTTVEELPAVSQSVGSSNPAARSNPEPGDNHNSREEKVILKAIRDDPFYTISELKLVIEESLLGSKMGWWGVFRILRSKKLLSRRSRFRYARQYRRQPQYFN
ncbi:MAG: STAS domain-containing protein [Candidatus Zixiibacteriota bacterium]|nr:MAG: STAS domain-containing protein [candidate division Zixibacteria bacterium]